MTLSSGFTLGHIADLVGAQLYHADPEVTVTQGVEFDSRKVIPGCVFLALPGEKVQGIDYAKAAINQGAVAVISTQPVLDLPTLVISAESTEESISRLALALHADHDGSGYLLLQALAQIARAYHRKYSVQGLTTIAITGSMGKTTTKDTVAQLLAALYGAEKILAAPGSLNNELGVPWLITHLQPEHRFLIVEMGARHKGDIAYLRSIVEPDVAVELGVGTAHLGEFGSVEAIAEAKGELIANLSPDAIVILNGDDPRVLAMDTPAHKLLFGRSANAHYRYQYQGLSAQGRAIASLTAKTISLNDFSAITSHNGEKFLDARNTGENPEYIFTSPLVGEQLLGNLMAAVMIAVVTGAQLTAVLDMIPSLSLGADHRMQLIELPDGTVIIDDGYNANPDSMRAALKFLAEFGHKRKSLYPQLRTWAVLGEMGELGDDSVVLHDGVGRYALRLNLSQLICVGNSRDVRAMYQAAVMEGSYENEALIVENNREAGTILIHEVHPGDIVLVKASNSGCIWQVAEQFKGEKSQ